MGKLKNLLIDLEDRGIITWSEEFGFYVLTVGDQTKEFDLNEYLETSVITTKEDK